MSPDSLIHVCKPYVAVCMEHLHALKQHLYVFFREAQKASLPPCTGNIKAQRLMQLWAKLIKARGSPEALSSKRSGGCRQTGLFDWHELERRKHWIESLFFKHELIARLHFAPACKLHHWSWYTTILPPKYYSVFLELCIIVILWFLFWYYISVSAF